MKGHFLPALSLLALRTFLTGLAYPLAVAGVSQIIFPRKPTAARSSRMARP